MAARNPHQHHYLSHQANRRQGNRYDDDDDDEEEDNEDSFDPNQSVDGIRRSFRPVTGPNYNEASPAASLASGSACQAARAGAKQQPASSAETIQVQLNESLFASEARMVRNSFVNLRTKLNSLQMFNPAQNSAKKQKMEEEWTEKEKYILDSLNEIKGPLDERFQWHQPEDGREVWPSKMQYFLAITSYSIGLGNVIRFPILVQKNGGLAFIVPFVIMLLLEGIPLLYLELAIGQRMRKAAILCWNLVSPFTAGIGLASAAVSFVIGLYYNTMVAWTLVYLSSSLTSAVRHRDSGGPLPFANCPAIVARSGAGAGNYGPPTPLPMGAGSHNQLRSARENVGLLSSLAQSNTSAQIGLAEECQSIGPFQYFWYRETLDISPDVNDWSNFNWPILFWLSIAWLISYACLVRGLSSSKRVVFVASTFPYVILIIFFFKALSLKGMSDGIYYLLEPKWSKLFDPYVWLQAAAQVFFSLGLGFGGLIALSSYNPVNNNCYKDAVRVAIVNFCTSMFAGIVIFAIIGFKANISHSKCQLEREQQIEFYLSDYNLKVLDYGAVFKQIPHNASGSQDNNKQRSPASSNDDNLDEDLSKRIGEFVIANGSRTKTNEQEEDDDDDERQFMAQEAEEYDYDSEDAIASINNLDRQLDQGSQSGSFDYSDSDTEFIINASSLISPDDLDKIIENIPNLQKCSIRKEMDEATQGSGLVFVVLAEALSQFEDNDKTWAIVFFFMILALGFDSQFGNLEGLISSLIDLNLWNNNNNQNLNGNNAPNNPAMSRQWITGIICATSLIISIIFFAHGAGSYMFAIFDEYAGSFSLVIIALFELLAMSYIYGLKRFCDDCELMTGKRPHFIILLSWRYISPILLLIVTLATIRQFSQEIYYEAWTEPIGHLVTKSWPNWCISLGAILIISCIAWIPLVAIMRILKLNIIPEQQLITCWFPAEELREFHDLQEEHKSSKLERILFGFKDED